MDEIEHDLTLLRSLVARELETINVYRSMAAESGDLQTTEFILHVVEEEKSHIADTLRFVALLDPDQAGLLRAGFADGHNTGHIPAGGSQNATSAFVGDAKPGSDGNVPVGEGRGSSGDPSMVEKSLGARASAHEEESLKNKTAKDRRVGTPGSWTVGSLRGIPQETTHFEN